MRCDTRYLPCAFESTCSAVLQAVADAVLPRGWVAATDLVVDSALPTESSAPGAAHDDEPEFNDRQLVGQYLTVLRDKKAM